MPGAGRERPIGGRGIGQAGRGYKRARLKGGRAQFPLLSRGMRPTPGRTSYFSIHSCLGARGLYRGARAMPGPLDLARTCDSLQA